MVTVQIYDARQKKIVTLDKIEKPDAEWEKLLTRKAYEITTRKGTEAPGSRTFDEVHEPGGKKNIINDIFALKAFSYWRFLVR